MLVLAIAAGLVAGSYLDPVLARLGFSESLIEEVRLRDIPFWFTFMAAGHWWGWPAVSSSKTCAACFPAQR